MVVDLVGGVVDPHKLKAWLVPLPRKGLSAPIFSLRRSASVDSRDLPTAMVRRVLSCIKFTDSAEQPFSQDMITSSGGPCSEATADFPRFGGATLRL